MNILLARSVKAMDQKQRAFGQIQNLHRTHLPGCKFSVLTSSIAIDMVTVSRGRTGQIGYSGV